MVKLKQKRSFAFIWPHGITIQRGPPELLRTTSIHLELTCWSVVAVFQEDDRSPEKHTNKAMLILFRLYLNYINMMLLKIYIYRDT